MSFYKEFIELSPYLQSVRKIKNYVSFDINFPVTWKLPKIYVDESKVMEHESSNSNERLFSYVSDLTEESINKVQNNIKNIIKYNLEREEKEKLFELKVEELKKIFEKQNLEKLKSLQFSLTEKKPKIELNYEDIEQTTNGVAVKGDK